MEISKQKLVAIAIPIYKEHLDADELVSLKQCLIILKSHPIIFYAPKSLNVVCYKKFCLGKIPFIVERFDDCYFAGTVGYNKLMLSLQFYKRFKLYKYILIYQLDAYVFKDELVYWCNQGFDYIGAPWFGQYAIDFSLTIGVGNGGFSLRNTKKHLKVLQRFSYIKNPSDIFRNTNFSGSATYKLKQVLRVFKHTTITNNTFKLFNNYTDNEDNFWGIVASRNFKWFKVPDVKLALNFSFELHPELSYGITNMTLPFGCHAWRKHNYNFWKQFISENNYLL